ncbi:12-oxophytodienoate reductase 1 [Phytophthora pseudosyringae]|uniref:12-oxophytodienoate reductase 1 n=1 Tax=Phytophthora pseudosyringae TaxID=221518 RepID=A0A8T1W6F4_9STRA|nr:12-oxophytodienoate reductase 1 [Phytophthora pseudosyringae]
MEKYMRVQKAACPVTSVLIANNGISTVKKQQDSTSEHVVKEPGSSHDYADRFDVEEVSSRAVLVSPGADSLENRVRILYEALEAVLSGVDSNKVGIRLSPYGSAFGCSDSAPGDLYSYTMEKFNDYDLVYLHLVESRGIQAPAPDAPEDDELPIFRKGYHGFIITASGYDCAEVIKVTVDGSADCVASRVPSCPTPTVKLGSELN